MEIGDDGDDGEDEDDDEDEDAMLEVGLAHLVWRIVNRVALREVVNSSFQFQRLPALCTPALIKLFGSFIFQQYKYKRSCRANSVYNEPKNLGKVLSSIFTFTFKSILIDCPES